MNNIHRAHRAPRIIKNPLLIQINVPPRKLLTQLARDERHDASCVIAMSRDGAEREIVQIGRVEDVEPVEVRVEELVDECQHSDDYQGDGGFAGE